MTKNTIDITKMIMLFMKLFLILQCKVSLQTQSLILQFTNDVIGHCVSLQSLKFVSIFLIHSCKTCLIQSLEFAKEHGVPIASLHARAVHHQETTLTSGRTTPTNPGRHAIQGGCLSVHRKYFLQYNRKCMHVCPYLTHWRQFDFATTHISHRPQPEYSQD